MIEHLPKLGLGYFAVPLLGSQGPPKALLMDVSVYLSDFLSME